MKRRMKEKIVAMFLVVCMVVQLVPAVALAGISSQEVNSPIVGIYLPKGEQKAGELCKVEFWAYGVSMSPKAIHVSFNYQDGNYELADSEGNALTDRDGAEVTDLTVLAKAIDTGVSDAVIAAIRANAEGGVIQYTTAASYQNTREGAKIFTLYLKAKKDGALNFKLQDNGSNLAFGMHYSDDATTTPYYNTSKTGSSMVHKMYVEGTQEANPNAKTEYQAALKKVLDYVNAYNVNLCADDDQDIARNLLDEFGDHAKVAESTAAIEAIYVDYTAQLEKLAEFSDEEKAAMQQEYIAKLHKTDISAYELRADMEAAVKAGEDDILAQTTRPGIKEACEKALAVLEFWIQKDDARQELKAYRADEIPEAKKADYTQVLEENLALLLQANKKSVLDASLKKGQGLIDALLDWPAKEDGFYQIKTAEDLEWLAQLHNGGLKLQENTVNAELCNDIDLSTICSEEIGSWVSIQNYGGTFDGNGYTISNLYSDCALFGTVTGTIRNLTVTGTVESSNSVATIVQTLQKTGVIDNCINKATVTGLGGAAGIVNSNIAGTVRNCVNEATITGMRNVGGISTNNAAYVSSVNGVIKQKDIGKMIACRNTGKIIYRVNTSNSWSSGECAGGITGGCSSDLLYCWNSGDVVAVYPEGTEGLSDSKTALILGGVAGAVGQYATVVGCYNTGSITREGMEWSSYKVGALFGTLNANTVAAGNYYLKNLCSEMCPSGVGGQETDTADVTTAMPDDPAAWTLEEVWKMNSGNGSIEGSSQWALSSAGPVYADEDTAGVYRVGFTQDQKGYVALERGKKTFEKGYEITSGRKVYKISIKEKGYSFAKLIVNGENELDSAGNDTTYYFVARGDQDVVLNVGVTNPKAAAACKKAIQSIGEVTNLSKDAITKARTAYDALSPYDQGQLKEELRTLENAEAVLADLEKFTMGLSELEYVYDGQEKTPAVEVHVMKEVTPEEPLPEESKADVENANESTGEAGSTEPAEPVFEKVLLVNGTDYTVAYEKNVNAGTARAVVTLLGEYATTGKLAQEYTITPVDISKASVKLEKTAYSHTGKTIVPKVTVSLGKNLTLKAGTDYKVSYKSNVKPGTAKVTIKGIGNYAGTIQKTFEIRAAKKQTYTVGSLKYQVTNASTKSGTVTVTGVSKKTLTKVSIPSTVKIGNYSYKVTAIGSSALKGCTSLTSVTIGSNVKEIGANAFYGDKKLEKITVKSTKITTVGKNALKGISSKAVIKVPADKLKSYQKVFAKKGQSVSVTIKK